MRTVADVRAVPNLRGGRIDLTWSLPPSSDYVAGRRLGKIQVVRRERTFPRDPADGELVYDGAPVTGVADRGLTPQRTYYYTVYAVEQDEPGAPPQPDIARADQSAQAAALATTDFGSTGKLFALLPGAHQSYDVGYSDSDLERIALDDAGLAHALANLPADIRGTGQLRRFLRAAAAPLDLMRSTAEALSDLHDIDTAPPQFLPLLAAWLGWDVDTTLTVDEQRNEIRFAPSLYRRVGTVDSLRRLVTRYTGWHTRAIEMEQALIRSNQPAQLNVYASAETPGGWIGTDDASAVLGFGPGNRAAAGAPANAAQLVGSNGGPFALRPGMELTVTVDDRFPTTVRFQPGDFGGDLTTATADDVAAAIGAALSQLTATVAGGRVVLTSHLVGAGSSIVVAAASANVVSLDGAPRGRLAVFPNGKGVLRAVYATADPLAAARLAAVRATLRGELPPVGPAPGDAAPSDPAEPIRDAPAAASVATDRILVKTWTGGAWRAARPLAELPPGPQGDPAACATSTGVFCAWVDMPGTAASHLSYAVGQAAGPPSAAVLTGLRSEPFVVEPGTRLVFVGRWPTPQGVEISAAELGPVDPAHATAAEVRNLLQPHLPDVKVTVGPRNTLQFSTNAAGGDERIALDLDASTAAASLGFGPGNASAVGDWGDTLLWSKPAPVAGGAAGRYADTFALEDTTVAPHAVDLFWSVHDGTHWRVKTSRYTAAWGAVYDVAGTGAANREVCAVRDATGKLHAIWAQQSAGADRRWLLKRRTRTGLGGSWTAEATLFTAANQPPAGRDGDREPAALLQANGTIRIFFRSDRSGGSQIWSTVWNPVTNVVSAPAQVTTGAPHRASPAPVSGPDGRTWLLHRSDANVSLRGVGVDPEVTPVNRLTVPEPPPPLVSGDEHSAGVEDLGTRRRYAGSTSMQGNDLARVSRRRDDDDLIAYTPQRTVPDPSLFSDDDLYTRNTVALYLSPTDADDPLSLPKERRLLPALQRFVPINVRPVIVLIPRPDVETFTVVDQEGPVTYPLVDPWPPTTDDAADDTGFIEFFSDAPPAPPAHLSVDPAQPNTLRHRTFREGA